MKKVIAVIFVFLLVFGTVSVFATSATNAANTQLQTTTPNTATGTIAEAAEKVEGSVEYWQNLLGNDTYGVVMYVLNDIVRVYSIPFGFIGIVIAAIYRYVIGIRKLDVQDKGFGVLVAIITVMVICQVLPLVFIIVVNGWRG